MVIANMHAKSLITRESVFAPGPLAYRLVSELRRQGHTVRLYAPHGADLPKPFFDEGPRLLEYELRRRKMTWREFQDNLTGEFEKTSSRIALQIAERAYLDAKKGLVDVVHIFSGMTAVNFAPFSEVPTVITLHDKVGADRNPLDTILSVPGFPKVNAITISNKQRKPSKSLRYVRTVYNGIDVNEIPYSEKGGSRLIWLGRLLPKKGLHTAVKVADKTGIPLNFACSLPQSPQKKAYWEKNIEPYMKKGIAHHMGYLSNKKWVRFFQDAKALLFPIEWEEPFGMVMIEAMSAGTPVIAYGRGSVPEIVKDGKTGFIVKNMSEMVAAVKKVDQINREDCRRHVENTFSAEAMANGYLAAYKKVIS